MDKNKKTFQVPTLLAFAAIVCNYGDCRGESP